MASLLSTREENQLLGGQNYKKIISLVTVFVMALTLTMSVCAVEISPTENAVQYRHSATPPLEPMTSFRSCPVPGCNGLVSLVCSGRIASETTPAPFACSFSAHYDYGNCNHYSVIYYNSGNCNSCYRSIDVLMSNYGFADITHNHAYKHVYLISGTTPRTEYMPACNI